jgi:hypothetical protein
MKRRITFPVVVLAVWIAALIGFAAMTFAAPQHHLNDGSATMGTVLPGQWFPVFDPVPEGPAPELATGCYISPSTGHYVKATCPRYSGSGSRGFQVRGRAWNGCNKFIYLYGTSGVAGSRSSYIPGPGPGWVLPWPWVVVVSWIVKTSP